MLDPACGTGGFLVEAYQHLEKQCQTVGERCILQNDTLFGGEAKPFPYLLCQMNLLLHGLEAPEIDPGNSLALPALRDRRQGPRRRDPDQSALRRRGGGGHQRQFPGRQADVGDRAAVPSAHHAQAQATRPDSKPGRAAVVVPNGTLFGDGVCARIKEELLKDFNLHTIVRLPNGVFAPYTSIPTNLLFFDRSGPTEDIWYYEIPLPEGRKNYSKTKPMQYEEFADCIAWWQQREENEHAWRVRAEDVLRYDADGRLLSANLDLKNPNSAEALEHLPPEQLVEDILAKERRIIEIMHEIKASSRARRRLRRERTRWPAQVPLQKSRLNRDEHRSARPYTSYRQYRVCGFGARCVLRATQIDWRRRLKVLTLFRVRAKQFIYSRLLVPSRERRPRTR